MEGGWKTPPPRVSSRAKSPGLIGMSQKILESENCARTPNHNSRYENNFRGGMSRKISELEKLRSYPQLEFAIKHHENSVNRKISR